MRSQVPHAENYGYLELRNDVDKLNFHGNLYLFILSMFCAVLQQGMHIPFNISQETSLRVKVVQ